MDEKGGGPPLGAWLRLSTRSVVVADDEAAKEKLEAAEWKSLTDTLTNWNFGVGHCKLDRGETTTTGICPAISGATPILPLF